MRLVMSLLAVSLALSIATASQSATEIVLDSQPGDYVGEGKQQTLTPADGAFAASRNLDGGVSIDFSGGALGFWNLDFAAPMDAPLVPGTYEGATRFPFQSSTIPGLSIFGAGRGCNTLTGRFTVLEATYGPTGAVLAFAADFEQHCEGEVPALFGAVRFNSTIAPENPDNDGDGVNDDADNCPAVPNPEQENADGDDFGDVCDPFLLDPDNLGACLDALALNLAPDQDGDGEATATDRCPGSLPGAAVDDSGCSQAQFCAQFDATTSKGKTTCKKTDWKNDEPAMKSKERDCVIDKGAVKGPSDDRCVAAPIP